jgi:hypothetical protein
MATKKIRKKPCYELMNRFSLAQIVEMIEAEKRRKQRLEWYLQEVMLEKETLVNEPAMLPWHSRCLILPSELSPVTVTSLLMASTSLTTAGASHLATFVFNTHPSSPSSTSSSPPFSPPLEASSSSSSPDASPAQSTSSSTSTSPLSSSWEGDWRHGSSEEEQLNFNNSGDDLDQATQLAREQWDPSELWWQDAFPDPLANPTVTYGCPF